MWEEAIKNPRNGVGFFTCGRDVAMSACGALAVHKRRRQISILVPNSTTRLAGMLKKSVGFAAF
ncbi:hypothetical protein LMG9964_04982 [Paraburkholderia phenoliruptrix]|uniref:Uncharacterized protein n=1 Tax=Paraburkholderia phenoliruptrix TaxID=252970 RepID=A0A6J5KE92_9BURK|nr:hypothetical protein [Paraburkholderia phenoliruptrix]CAB4051305.1 hypothetical protein LMG9964_04982 [Paraburkholderia phenoliruptrix]